MKATLNGVTIEMNREKTGSGIAASNEHYKYTEWKGEIKHEKVGKINFESKRQQ